jgi:hypothetical protein
MSRGGKREGRGRRLVRTRDAIRGRSAPREACCLAHRCDASRPPSPPIPKPE